MKKYLPVCLVVFFACIHMHVFAYKSCNVAISFPEQIDRGNVRLGYDNGVTGEIPISPVLQSDGLMLKEKFYASYASIHIYFPGAEFQFFVSDLPAQIIFTADEEGTIVIDTLVHAWDHGLMGENKLNAFLAVAHKDFDDFYAINGPLIGENDSLFALAKQKADRISDKRGEFVVNNDDLYYSFWLFRNETVKDPVLSYDSLLNIYQNSFNDDWKNSGEGEKILALIEGRKLKKGHMAPGIEAISLQGTPINLDQYIGKYVVLNFWSSACGPCLAEMPTVIAARNAWPPEKLAFIFISSDTDSALLNRTVKKHRFGFGQHIIRTSDILEKYAVYAVPHVCIINPEGLIIYSREEDKDYSLSTFSKLLAEELAPK